MSDDKKPNLVDGVIFGFASLEEAVAACRLDPWCPKDATDEQIRGWVMPFVRRDAKDLN